MIIKRVNGTDYAEIYGLFDDTGVMIGTREIKIAGIAAGKSFYATWNSKYNRREIAKLFKETERAEQGGNK